MAQERSPKILIIGSLGHTGVECLRWDLHRLPNLKDFDIVVTNSEPLITTMREMETTKDEQRRQFLDFYLRRTSEQLLGLLQSGGKIFAIFHPRDYLHRHQPPYVIPIDNTRWLPFDVCLDFEEGDTVIVKDQAFARYLDKVRRWKYVFRPLDYESGSGWLATQIPLAVNRAEEPIAVCVSYMASPRPVKQGFLVLLPPPTEATVDEAVRILLEDFCGVQPRSVAPGWAQSVATPGDDARGAEVAEATRALEEAEHRHEQALAAQLGADEFKRLLYEKGLPLQEVARKTFEAMGIATVESPVSDEFMLVWDDEKVLVEVTGTGKSISGRDLSQLMKDLSNYLADVGQDVKGVLIGNAWAALPPYERDTSERPIFPDNVQRTARNRSIALLSTLELFKAYCAFLEGNLSADEAFRRLIDTSGPVKLVD
jgi:hypothetical protein